MSVTAIQQPATGAAGAEEPKKKGKLKLILIVVVVLAVVGGAAYWFVLKPKSGKPPAPKPGIVVKIDPIQINLSGEHYLRIGIALQLVDGVKEADGSKALDATIDEFSGKPISEVDDPVKRRALKKELEKHLAHLYEKEVMGVYFTEYVTQ